MYTLGSQPTDTCVDCIIYHPPDIKYVVVHIDFGIFNDIFKLNCLSAIEI